MARYDGHRSGLNLKLTNDRRSYIKFLRGLHYGQKKAKRSRMLRQFRNSPDIRGMRATNT